MIKFKCQNKFCAADVTMDGINPPEMVNAMVMSALVWAPIYATCATCHTAHRLMIVQAQVNMNFNALIDEERTSKIPRLITDFSPGMLGQGA